MARTPWAPAAPALAAAALAVDAVICGGQSADAALAAAAMPGRPGPGGAPAPDAPVVRAIALGTLRWYLRLRPALEQLLTRPGALQRHAWPLLAVAAHQVEYSRNAPEATVHATVDAARLLGMRQLTGLMNAVLRRFVSERAGIFARLDASLATRTAHPGWLVERLCAAWPEQCAEVLVADNAHPPMTLRVDLSKTTRALYLARLAEQSIDASAIQWSQTGINLNHPLPVSALPGFSEGIVSVQDVGAQLAGDLLQLSPGMRVLDACAAPGGKTGHLLELMGPGAEVTALDIDAERTALIAENLSRLRRTARVCEGDARDPQTFWNGRVFERILVDAPCSSTGVIRRHPDIKLLRRASDVPGFAETQLAILRAAVSMLAAGGRLLYSTCSLLPEENEQMVAALLAAEPSVHPAQMPLAASVPGVLVRPFGIQLLPGTAAGSDGFYYACVEKATIGA